jgi:ribonuclease P protein component
MKRKTIRKHSDFITSRDCIILRCGFLILKLKPAKITGDARYGLVVSKKHFKLAIQRNRAKRLIRDWITYNENLMAPTMDYIFILNTNILQENRENGRQEVKKVFNKALKLLKKPVKNDENK